jgi:glycosyltransferase involved in cell wall biosynthesis
VSAPRVSVLLPAYQAAATLAVCLASLARQTEPRWECILVDDGSRDDTRRIADAFAARDGRLRVVGTSHRGLVAALGEGLRHCGAPLVARMDADDVMRRDRLAQQLAALERAPSLVAVGAHVRVFPRAGMRPGLRAYERWLNAVDGPAAVRREAFIECPVVHPTLVVRTDVLRAFGWRDAGWPEDYDLVLRLLAAGHDIGIVPRRLLAWRDRPARLTRTGAAYRAETFPRLKAEFLASGFLRAHATYVLWGYGGTARALRRALAAHGRRPSHVVDVHPRRIGQRVGDAPVVPIGAIPTLRGRPLVVSVAGARPRREIRAALAGYGLVETRDFVCAA